MLISTSAKPVVKLLINRHNNKYSYTRQNISSHLRFDKFILIDVFSIGCSASDDNLLKNLELFDKLSLRFSGRVLFLKDVIGSQEICLWSFFGHGKKVAEVCCTSIVYATDKKHTNVSTFGSKTVNNERGIEYTIGIFFRLNFQRLESMKKHSTFYCTNIVLDQMRI